MALTIQELIQEADRCVACGLCLPHCPTYRKTGSEADSPRGRIQLMRAVAQDILPNNDRFKQHIDLCLSCRSCESACPNNVQYGALADTARAVFVPKKHLLSGLLKLLIRQRKLANLALWPLWLLQKTRLQNPISKWVPAAGFLPEISKPTTWKPRYAATAPKKGAVSLFLGCTSQALDQATLTASIAVLNALGFDVHVPASQTCCGGIARQMGDADESARLIATNQRAFDASMPIITVASGCGAGLCDYLSTHRIQDISAFLSTCDWSGVQLSPLEMRVFVQDPCTLRNVQKSHQAVYQLLKTIPALEVVALPGNSQCCGGAGTYMLNQKEMADRLFNDKLSAIKSNHAVLLATSNIGCSLHIARGLRAHNESVTVVHPVQIIAKQLGFQS